MTTTATTRFKKDAEGAWGIVGPADQITAGATVAVTKRDGSTCTVTVQTVADEPNADDTIFAWIAPTRRPVSRRSSSPRRGSTARRTTTYRRSGRRACVTGGNCSSFSGRNCGGHDCDAN